MRHSPKDLALNERRKKIYDDFKLVKTKTKIDDFWCFA